MLALRQTKNDLAAQVVMDLIIVRDADRQLELFEKTVLPRARQGVTLSRGAYEAGQTTFLELLENQRSLITMQKLVANLKASREKRLADLESISARPLAESSD